jgi:glutaredoxin
MRLGMLELYTKRDCSVCEQTKNLLKTKNVEYVEYLIEYDITKEDVLAKFPGVKKAPIIVLGGYRVGFVELRDIIERGQLGSFM